MTGTSDAPPATASGPGVPYAEWPSPLGDPRWRFVDHHGDPANAKSRAEIIAQYRRSRPEIHGPVSAKDQLKRVRKLEQTKFPSRICSFQVLCRRGRATKKCHHCVQFDELRLGFYCDACFEARHPPYRLGHAWDPLEDIVDHEQNWITHLTYHNLEQDARELQLLLAQTQTFLQSTVASTMTPPSPERRSTNTKAPDPPAKDTLAKMRTPTGELDFQRVRESVSNIATTLKQLMQQIQSELAKKPLTREDALRKIQAMWRIRKARKQMRELIRSVYQSFTDPASGQVYYFNTRTRETKWTKPKGLGASELKPTRNQEESEPQTTKMRVNRFREINDEGERHESAVKCIQGMARSHSARRHLRQLISSVYEKIWDPRTNRFYYHNTKSEEVKWEKPRWVSDDELLTPRTREARDEREARELKQRKLASLRETMTLDDAAAMVQRAFRRKRGFKMLLDMCRGVYERLYDADAGMYYYHNTRTKEVTWDKPRLLQNATADVFSPRSREQHLKALLSSIASRRPRVEWTEESAAVRLQGLFRARRAKRDLDARLAEAYKKVWDSSSERFYYANLKTGDVSWDPPAILMRRQGVQVEEIR